MKAKLLAVLVVVAFVYSSVIVVSAETTTSVWREEMNYQSLNQLKAGGWTVTHEDGVSFSGSAIVLDGTSQDTAIHYQQKFPSGISNWKVEDKSRWTLGSHCGNLVTAITDKHSYSFQADGWYSTYVFYRDGQKTTFGNYQESKNTWFTLAIEKQGNQINMYYNGEIKSTYTETDSATSQLIGVDAVSPWKGGSEYDYFEVWQIGDTSTQEAQQSLLSNPIVIGGIIGAVGVGVGGVLYFFVLGGGAAGGTSGGSAAGGAGVMQNQPTNPSSGGSLSNPLSEVSDLPQMPGFYDQQISNVSDINSIFQDFTQSVNGILSQNNQTVAQSFMDSISSMIVDPQANPLVQNLLPSSIQSTLPIETLNSTQPGASPPTILTNIIDHLINSGQQIVNQGTAQGSVNQDSYQNYLEQTTNLMESLSQMINAQQTATSNATHIQHQ